MKMPLPGSSNYDSQISRASNRKTKQGWLLIFSSYTVMLTLTFSAMALGSSPIGLTEVRIGSSHAEHNAATTVPVMIYNAADLGSVDLDLTFNPDVVTVTSITAGDFDMTVTNIEETTTGFVKVLAFQAANPGLNGTVVLARVTLSAVGAVDSTTPLNITVNRMTDATPCCRNTSCAITNGSFTVIPTAESTHTPTPTATPSPENGGGGQRFSISVDSDGDGYSDHYERLTGSNPDDPCDPDPTCSACQAPVQGILPVEATTSESPRATPVPSPQPTTPVPAIESAPPSAKLPPKPVLEVTKPPAVLMLILIAAILLSGLLILAGSRRRQKKRR